MWNKWILLTRSVGWLLQALRQKVNSTIMGLDIQPKMITYWNLSFSRWMNFISKKFLLISLVWTPTTTTPFCFWTVTYLAPFRTFQLELFGKGKWCFSWNWRFATQTVNSLISTVGPKASGPHRGFLGANGQFFFGPPNSVQSGPTGPWGVDINRGGV